ncbi:MAG: Flp family type IVb pilin [Candidatus Dormibacteraeota bacterium]|nr:Flp family type IVb pilin [Candidatus Dormibacteraeota bacterium]
MALLNLLFARRAQAAERGQGLVEYALILVLVAIGVVVVLSALGTKIQGVFTNITSALGT